MADDSSSTSESSLQSTTTIQSEEAAMAELRKLKLQRSYKRGQITRLVKRLSILKEKHPASITQAALECLTTEIKECIAKHDDIQREIDETAIDPFAYTDEDERLKHEEIHDQLLTDIESLTITSSAHRKAKTLLMDMESLIALGSAVSSREEEFAGVRCTKATLHQEVMALPDDLEVQSLFNKVNSLFSDLHRLIATSSSRTSSSSSPTSTIIHSTTHDRPRMAPLNLEIPKFSGDPLQWEAFELNLKSLLKHRAEGFSDIDKFSIIRQAITPQKGKQLIADKMKAGASIDQLLDDLRHMYGRTQLIVPILVKKCTEPPMTDHTASDMRRLEDQVLDPYRTLCTHLKGDLNLFFPHFLRPFLTGKLREEWDRLLFEKLPKPTMDDFNEFIKQRLLWTDADAKFGSTYPSSASQASSASSNSSSNSPVKKKYGPPKCASCGGAHWVGRCSAFIAMSTDERNTFVREKRLCLNCLTSSHTVRQCNNKHTCRVCSLKHHSLLHRESQPRTNSAVSGSSANSTPLVAVVESPSSVSPPVVPVSGSFICTVMARVQHEGTISKARVLIDHASGGSFMTEQLASHLGLKRHPQDRLFAGFGQGTVHSKFKVFAKLSSTSSDFTTPMIEFSITPKALHTSPPADRDTVLGLADDHGLVLSDPSVGGRIDILLGEEHPWDLCGSVTKIGRHRFIPTEFGYGVTGPLASRPSVFSIVQHESTLQEDLAKLWALDRVPEATTYTTEELQAVDVFQETTSLQDGRVVVSLPFKTNHPTLGDSQKQAMSRFFSNERSLKAKEKLTDFNLALQEYLDLGHAHIVPPDQLKTSDQVYYMPVHGVFKDTSTSTKTRPVFDASAKTTSGASLNDCLLIGPNLYPQLADVLVKFRTHCIGLSADISKMFREILLNPEHQNLHRFLLRGKDGLIHHCRMERVTFGVASSPFLATQTLRFLANKFNDTHPRAAQLIREVFYVDDFVSGAASVEEALALREELCGLLSMAGMTLRKWRSSSTDFLEKTPADLRESESTSLPLHESTKALGAHWDTSQDMLYVSVPTQPSTSTTVTKRLVASISAAVFDVMGLFAPFTILPRTLLQETWKLQLQWDKELPEHLLSLWNSWVTQLPEISKHPIPRRFVNSSQPAVFSSLHGFCDASAIAYGAAVYLRSVTADGSTQTVLVSAKARVLPTKHVTIPRAELLGAHLLAKLLSHVADTLNISPTNSYAWSDSAIVLHWMAKDSSQLKDRFVANRIQNCHDLLPHTRWKHVKSEENPADLASRGTTASELVHSTLWWSGPWWLSQTPDCWPNLLLSKPKEAITVLTISPSLSMNSPRNQFLSELWNRYSSFHHLTRIISWIYRFYNKLKKKDISTNPTLTSQELRSTQIRLLHLSHLQDFPEVFAAIKDNRTLPKQHPLHNMLPLLVDGKLRLRSRIRSTTTPTTEKLLTPLHSKSRLTKLLVATLHRDHLHAGVSALHSIISNTYYVKGLRNLIKSISRGCAPCQRAYAKPVSHQLGLLPSVRTTPSLPFLKTGIDFAGPFLIRKGHTRKPVIEKAYAAVFICMTTKAVHLELCASLSTEDFLATLSRFISRRGCPSDFFSDHGTNFQGAREEIRELEKLLGSKESKEKTSHFTQRHGIQWHFIPPRAPHFGGLWEAAVRSMKTLLRKTLQPHKLRFDELSTVLAEAESVLNSRPLTPISQDDTQSGDYLTAGHFLVGRHLRSLPSSESSSGNINILTRWRLVARLKHDLWKSWIKQYLQTLHERNKWTRPQQPLKPNDIVFLKDDTLKGRTWPVGRVIQTFPGDDGQVRVVKLLCRGKEYTRATQLLIPLHKED